MSEIERNLEIALNTEIDALRHHYVCALGISGGCPECHQYNEVLARLFKRKGWRWKPQFGGNFIGDGGPMPPGDANG